MLGVEGKPIKQVKFHGRLGESYVTASPAQMKAATRASSSTCARPRDR